MKIVLIIEDLPEEQAKAKAAAMQHGYRAAISGTLEDALRIWKSLEGKIVGIITDLHFPERTDKNPNWSDPSKPCGLAIVAKATRQGMPVVVCSDLNHHYAYYVELVVWTFSQYHPAGKIPLIMNAKDWNKSIIELEKLINPSQEEDNE